MVGAGYATAGFDSPPVAALTGEISSTTPLPPVNAWGQLRQLVVMPVYLTKSDFKACFDCRTRLFYRKAHYPSAADENEYLRFLADGGFMVEFIAKAKFPEGVDLVGLRDPVQAAQKTAELLAAGNVTLFEAGVVHGKFHIRTDILRRQGQELELIEVKSSAIEDDEDDAASPFLTKKGTVQGRWKPYLLDVAFQKHVLQLAYPQFTVKARLCVVDKARVATSAETLGHFHLVKAAANSRPEVHYGGSLAALRQSQLLVTRDVDAEVATLRAEVIEKAEALAALIDGDAVRRVQEPISEFYGECRDCDYRIEATPSGFAECWGELAGVNPHVLDLHRVTQIATGGAADPVKALLASGRASLLDLGEKELGSGNSYTVRRLIQWRTLRDKLPEHLPGELRQEIAAHGDQPGWPLHFIDFEACDLALPHHAGLKPYERVAFQWSCHTVQADGTVHHREWLNDSRDFPNFAFARSLREWIGEAGTVYVWSPYEQVTLRKILEQVQAWLARDAGEAVRLSGLADPAAVQDLAGWIERLLGPADAKGKRESPRIRDLHKSAQTYYFHPRMGGRTSIKVVLPAVWESDARLRALPLFAGYEKRSATGALLSPYDSLPALPLGDGGNEDDAVREGTGAIRVYQDLVFATDGSAADRANRRQLLLQYCRLDTAAMVMIWARWLGRYDLREARA